MREQVMSAAAAVVLMMAAGPAADRPWPLIRLGPKVAAMKQPTHITHAGDGSERIFITEQMGRIVIIKRGIQQSIPFLDIRDRVGCCGERGLLSVAFPPAYGKKQYFYINYTDKTGDTVVARYRVSTDRDRADRNTEEVILRVKQPFPNHNGGQMAFGPDGFLYIGLGDGGAANDPFGNGQDKKTLLGKLLRIDVESGRTPYGVPSSNPFLSVPGARPELWATGLRNPWRFSFDRGTGDLFIADVGQNRYEEVNVQPASGAGGENYGWNIMEGAHCFGPKPCSADGLVLPVAEYGHQAGCSVTGGMVYRGAEFPVLGGIYLYGDYCSGRIWGLRRHDGEWRTAELLDTTLSISTFGEDEGGEVYVADHHSGAVHRIESTR